MNSSIDTSFTLKVQLFSIMASLSLVLFIISLIKKEYIREGYALLWLFTALMLVIFSVFSSLLFRFSDFIGIYYAPMTLVLILLFGLIFISIHFSVLISKQEKQIKELTQEAALMKNLLNKKTNKKGKK